jgi:hypothetical protein
MSCRTYRLERQLIIRVAKQYKDEPGLLKFVYLFKNVITVNEILKFLKKIEIAIRNGLQNQGRIKKKRGWNKSKNRDTKRLHAVRTVTEPTVILLFDGIRSMQNIHSQNQRQAVEAGVIVTRR